MSATKQFCKIVMESIEVESVGGFCYAMQPLQQKAQVVHYPLAGFRGLRFVSSFKETSVIV